MADPDDRKTTPTQPPPDPAEPWAGNEERRADYLADLMGGKAYRIPAAKTKKLK